MAIIGMHALIYSKKADEARRVLKDALGWKSVDAGRGWLIFEAPPTEIAVHPAEGEERHELYLMCDDINQTVSELKAKGIDTTGDVIDQGFGLVTAIRLPSGDEIGLYEPRHPMAIPSPTVEAHAKQKK